jgi:tetratricopeptide (TPR) repeat protein
LQRMKKAICFFILFVSIWGFSPSQTSKGRFFPAANDTAALKDLVTYTENFKENNPDSVEFMSKLVLKIISENKEQPATLKKALTKIKIIAHHQLGLVYHAYADYPKAIFNYERSLKLSEEINDAEGMAASFNDLAQVYEDNGDKENAFRYYNKSLQLVRSLHDKEGESDAYNNIAHIYQNYKKYDTAMIYHRKSLEIRRAIKDTTGIAMSLNNIGTVYFMTGDFEAAERYFRESIPLRERAADVSGWPPHSPTWDSFTIKGKNIKKQLKLGIRPWSLAYSSTSRVRSVARQNYYITFIRIKATLKKLLNIMSYTLRCRIA